MKRFSIFILAILITMGTFPFDVAAAKKDSDTSEIIMLADGDYIVVTLIPAVSRATQVKGKEYVYYNNSADVAEWVMTLTGTFTYDGRTSSCTSSRCTVTIYDDSGWELVSKSATKSGNTAYAEATFAKKLLGVTISRPTYEITLTCDKDGNMS